MIAISDKKCQPKIHLLIHLCIFILVYIYHYKKKPKGITDNDTKEH